MEKFEELLCEVRRHWQEAVKTQKQELASDLIRTIIGLSKYKPLLIGAYEENLGRMLQRAQQNYMGNGILAVIPPISLPILFVDNQPALQLYIYNIKENLDALELAERFNSLEIFDFTVLKVRRLNHGRAATVLCHSLTTSFELQCLGLLKQLRWAHTPQGSNKLIEGHMMVKLDGKQTAKQTMEAPLDFQSSSFLPILSLPEINEKIATFLQPIDKNNLFIAINKMQAFFRALVFPTLTVNLPAFSGQQTSMACLAILLHNPTRISFSSLFEPISLPAANIILRAYARRNAQEREPGGEKRIKRLIELDLTGVCVNETTMYYLSKNFEIPAVKFADTKSHIDKDFKMHGLQALYVENNDNFIATCLYDIAFINLKKLEIINCNRIVLSSIANFLAGENSLTYLKLKDCIKVEKDRNVLHEFLNVVFSDAHFRYFYV